MPATFGGGVDEQTPAVWDTDPSQDTGAVSQGIGLVFTDNVSIGGYRIGIGAVADFLGDVGDGGGGPEPFTPASLFANGETGVWLKSSDIATLFQLSDGTTDVAANNDPVGYWADQSGNGNHLIQATAGSRPLYQTAGPGVLFDGSDDRLALASRLTATSGSFVARFTTGASQFEYPAAQVLLSCADTATATSWFEIGVDLYGRVYIEYNNAGTKHTVIGSTRLELSTSYSLIVVHNGEDFYVLLNGRAENPLIVTNVGTYAWFGDVASADNTVIGGTITSAGLVRPWRGSISEILITSKDITA